MCKKWKTFWWKYFLQCIVCKIYYCVPAPILDKLLTLEWPIGAEKKFDFHLPVERRRRKGARWERQTTSCWKRETRLLLKMLFWRCAECGNPWLMAWEHVCYADAFGRRVCLLRSIEALLYGGWREGAAIRSSLRNSRILHLGCMACMRPTSISCRCCGGRANWFAYNQSAHLNRPVSSVRRAAQFVSSLQTFCAWKWFT